MKIKLGDTVRVITGENKGKEGKIIGILKKQNRVVIDGVNMVKKHVKPNAKNETGGILEVEAPIHISNVKVLGSQKKEAKKEVKKETKKEDKKVKTVKKASKESK